ncbi:hypothetical protein G6L37_32485 [Agrobacterium rubi]|uniref:hypothetical protein n=1 Tax=Agrobacterium rubi TaxID=28099 RepID=UPI000DE0C257|nr:hypothetical protein [Agrobacterium rubi]NTF10716.1 hypothetical protein [Agrobacterium rubi]NTF23110.1 hypothetical protein [Agrobacterium rubi]NTF30041.1 hypothetical protein [Agrobacterium rubi]
MPFFLVTQTSLVEGKDEISAAEKTLRQIREADEVAFSVKFDEETITQVSISVPGKMLEETASTGAHLPRPAEPTDNGLEPPHSVVAPALGRGFLSTTALVATGVVVGAAWSHWIA